MTTLAVQVAERTRVFHSRFTAGRDEGGTDLWLDDQYVSTLHAVFHTDGDGWYVEDCGSTNGTWLNGVRVYGPRQLSRGDKIKAGRTIMTVVPA